MLNRFVWWYYTRVRNNNWFHFFFSNGFNFKWSKVFGIKRWILFTWISSNVIIYRHLNSVIFRERGSVCRFVKNKLASRRPFHQKPFYQRWDTYFYFSNNNNSYLFINSNRNIYQFKCWFSFDWRKNPNIKFKSIKVTCYEQNMSMCTKWNMSAVNLS